MEDVEAFAARAVAAMNDEGLAWVGDPATVAALLSLAADAAHGVVRPAAPIATFLAGIELGARSAGVINLSLGTPNMGKALLLRDCCANAVEAGAIVLAAAHPKGERAYPADLPETIGVASHPDCPLEKVYYFAPHRFPAKQWGSLTGKFLTHGNIVGANGQRGPYRGSGLATAYLAGRTACLREALPDEGPPQVIEILRQSALTPVPEIGYA